MSFLRAGILERAWDLGAGIQALLGLRAPEEQGRLSWARKIDSIEKVPIAFRRAFEALVGGSAVLPYTVFVPSSANRVNRTKEKLVCLLDGTVYVLEQTRDDVAVTCFPAGEISHVQVGSILLNSWIKIRRITSDHVLSAAELRFNTVTDYLFTPIIENMRPAMDCAKGIDEAQERSKFAYLRALNFKLMNYARRSIKSGERVVQIILQPSIRVEMLRLLGRSFFRMLETPHISILTDRELILIQDGGGKEWGRDIRYGGIWNYISLNKIASVSSTATQNGLLTLSIHLPGDERIDSLFLTTKKPEIEELQRQIKESRKNSASW